MEFSPENFIKATGVSRETLDKLNCYAELLKKWQKSKNLVSDSTLSDMWLRHFYDSAQLLPLIQNMHKNKNLRCLDIGSGAGFPGLVLAIMGIGSVTMVESNGKKCTFMRQVKLATNTDVTIENKRIELLDSNAPVDIILSRACASISQLLEWGSNFTNKETEFWLLKGATAAKELKEAKLHWTMDVDQYKSKSDGSGVIIRLKDIHRKSSY